MSISPKTALLEEYALVARALSAPARLSILEQLGARRARGWRRLRKRRALTIAKLFAASAAVASAPHSSTSRRDGKAVIYRLTDARTLALMDLLRVVAERNLAQVERILRGLSGGEEAPEPVSREDLAARIAEGFGYRSRRPACR